METAVIVPKVVWDGLLSRIEALEKYNETKEKTPSEIVWITRKQAAKILNKDVQTVSIMAQKKHLFEYRKGLRNIEFNLNSIKKYMKSTGVSSENIENILQK